MHGSLESKCVRPDDLKELDPKNVITTGRRTRGIRVDYTKVTNTEGLDDDDSESETETSKGPKKMKEAVKNPRTKSPERKQATKAEEEVNEGGEGEEGGEDEGEEDGQDGDLGDEDGDDQGDDDDDDDD